MATLRLTCVNVLKAKDRGGAGSVGRGSRCRSRGGAALCAGMTEILHPQRGMGSFEGDSCFDLYKSKPTFTSLVEKGLLVRQGGGRSTWYGLP